MGCHDWRWQDFVPGPPSILVPALLTASLSISVSSCMRCMHIFQGSSNSHVHLSHTFLHHYSHLALLDRGVFLRWMGSTSGDSIIALSVSCSLNSLILGPLYAVLSPRNKHWIEDNPCHLSAFIVDNCLNAFPGPIDQDFAMRVFPFLSLSKLVKPRHRLTDLALNS